MLTLISVNDKMEYWKHKRYANWKESFACAVINSTYAICKRLKKFRIRKHTLYTRMVVQKSTLTGRHPWNAALEFMYPSFYSTPPVAWTAAAGDLIRLTFCRALQQNHWWPQVIKGQQTLAWSNCSMNFGTFWVGSC